MLLQACFRSCCRMLTALAALLFASVLLPAPAAAAPIIADHTAVADYDKIPQAYLDQVKAMWVSVAGESHSYGYRLGCQLLQNLDPRFAALIRESGTPDGPTSSALRLSRATWGDVGNSSGWMYNYGEEDWYTSALAIQRTKASITYSNSGGLTLAAFGFGWCWDMTWQNAPGGTVDPVYQVRWAGSSGGGPQGNLRWGLDAADSALTGNSVCLDTYLTATEDYIAHCRDNGYPTVVFFTTGPVDGGGNIGENGYQRHLKCERIRDHVRASADRVLFDYADILCWSNGGQVQNVTWTDYGSTLQTFPTIHSDNMLDLDGTYAEDGDHIGKRGTVRLAKALWWMLARTAGWDGQPEGTDTTPPTGLVTINNGNLWTSSTAVALTLSASDGTGGSGVDAMRLSADGLAWGAWEPFAASRTWTLAGGEGLKAVYVQFRDVALNVSAPASDTIQLYTALPVITEHPASTTTGSGTNVLFRVVVDSVAPLTYQWRKNGEAIPGATGTQYSLTGVQLSDEGLYDCIVRNVLGAVTSNPASLTIRDSVQITAHPVSRIVVDGTSATFAVTAIGTPPPSYQWRRGGVDIPGATAASYTLNPVHAVHAGVYTCFVSNTFSSALSNPATLTVLAGRLAAAPTLLRYAEGTPLAVDVVHGGQPTTQSLMLTNIGTWAVNFTGGGTGTPGLALAGTNATSFRIDRVTPATTGPLAPGSAVTVVIRFAPQVTVRTLGLSARLEVTSDSPLTPLVTVPLTGDAVPLELSGFTVE